MRKHLPVCLIALFCLPLLSMWNELSLQVYSQKREYIFDLTFAMQQVTDEFNQFNASRRPYDRVLAAERIPYVDAAREIIYNALNNAGITIPFPQLDVHFDSSEE